MRIAILGSTGTIGVQSLEVIAHLNQDAERFKIMALSANMNIGKLEEQIRQHKPDFVAVYNYEKACELAKNVDIKVYAGMEGLLEVAKSADIIINSLVGSVGLRPTMKAMKTAKKILLANKETLVVAGQLVMNEAKKYSVDILPIDSEHSAIFQCFNGEDRKNVSRILLTCSGGPFRNYSYRDLNKVSAEQALKHPTWNMGKKITIDSATLMNKGFEVIEARYLFDLNLEQIEVVIHPESVIHSMVEYVDGSIVAQLSETDMRLPIQYALTYPERKASMVGSLNLFDRMFSFYRPDTEKFRCLGLAYRASKVGGTMPVVLNAANEIAVQRFLEGKIGFLDIPKLIEKAMDEHAYTGNPSLDEILELDEEIKEKINIYCKMR